MEATVFDMYRLLKQITCSYLDILVRLLLHDCWT